MNPIARKIQRPIVSITLEEHVDPTVEEIRFKAADLTLRVLALVKKKEMKKAMIRLTELNSLYRDFQDLQRNYAGIYTFLRYGHYYCQNPSKVKRKALLMLSLKAEPVINALLESTASYLRKYREDKASSDAMIAADELDSDSHKAYQNLGTGLDELKRVMPQIIESEEKKSDAVVAAIDGEVNEKEYEVLSKEDVYILERAGQAKVKELSVHQSAIIRASVILTHAHVGEMTRRKTTLEYGMQRVLGTYLLMTEGLVVGVSRIDEHGQPRSLDDIKQQASQILYVRNKVREAKGLPRLAMIQSTGITGRKLARHEVARAGTVNTPTHSFILLFDEEYLLNGEFHCMRWEFYRKPGDANVSLTGN